jgi:sugar phosphate isomerase/epimerase
MKISMVASSSLGYTLPRGSLEKGRSNALGRAFLELAKLGYDGVELSIEEPQRTEVREIERASEDCGVEIPAIGTGLVYGYKGLSLSDIAESRRRKAVGDVLKTIGIAADLGSIVIIGLVRGRISSDPKRCVEKFKNSMREVDRAAVDNGVKLALEPLNRYEADFINNVEQAMRFISSIGLEGTGVLLDTYHMNIEERSFEEAVERCGKKLVHVHVADSNRLAPGLGHIPFAKIIRTIASQGYDRYLSAEIMALPNPTEAARIAIKNLRLILDRNREYLTRHK